jgi:CO/xanthine dehydrogenase Mo-binding subunit
VRSVADVIAAVAAEDEETAQAAIEAIKIRYEPLPAVFTLEEALRPNAPLVHPAKDSYAAASYIAPFRVKDQSNVSTEYRVERGDIEAARARSDLVVAGRYRTQRIEHFSMEPHAAVALYDPIADRLTVWSSTGKPFRTLAQLAAALDRPINRINFVHLPAGGDFGGKGELTLEPYCAVLAMRTGRPVKGVYRRYEEFLGSTCKAPFDIALEMGFSREGHILFLDGDILVDCGAYNSMAAQVSIHGATHLGGPYDIPNVRIRVRSVYTNNIVSGSFRGFGTPQVTFGRESVLDQAAAELGIDPIELRLRNAWGPGSVTCTGQVLDPNRYGVSVKATLRAAAAASQWQTRRSASRKMGRIFRGVGVATGHHGIGQAIWFGADIGIATVKANTDGTITVISGVAEVGQGASTAMAQIVAEELGLPLSAIVMSSARETDAVPYDGGASASRTVYVVGSAMRQAASRLRERLTEVAAHMLEADPRDVECRDGRLFVQGAPARAVSLEDAVNHAMRRWGETPMASGTFGQTVTQLDGTGRGSPYQTFDYATQIAEVEVDTETGVVRVLRLISAQDVGKAINPLIVEGQIEGAMVMGLGYALTEEIHCEHGQVLNPHAFDYPLVRTVDLPELVPVILEEGDPKGPYGAKGVGEMGLIPTAAAIANAVYDAVGVRITALPITPEKVLRAVKAQERERG